MSDLEALIEPTTAGLPNAPLRWTTKSDGDVARLDLHDGSVADWLEVVGEPVAVARDFTAIAGISRVQYDPADLEFRVWLAWHGATGRIFLAMERVDDVYLNDYHWDGYGWTTLFHDSSLRLFVDGDHSGGQFFYDEDEVDSEQDMLAERSAQAQMYYATAR